MSEEFETGAIRDHLFPKGNHFPIRLDLVFSNDEGLRRLAETFGQGFEKYGADNWKNGFSEDQLITHTLEHLRLHCAGDKSEDHIAHAMWNLFALCWMQKYKPELCNVDRLSNF